MTNLIRSPRNAMRATPRLPILIAAVVAVVSGLLLASALTSPTARAQQLTGTVWTATMTVGTKRPSDTDKDTLVTRLASA